MKMKSILASVGACAIAVSAMAFSASAEKVITNANKEGNYEVECKELPVEQIVGIEAQITMVDGWEATGAGGGIVFNGKNCSWKQFEWGISGEGVDCKNTAGVTISGSNGKFTITYMGTESPFVADEDWSNLDICAWWGSDFAVDSLIPLDKDGKEVKAGGTASNETTAANTTAANTTTTTTAKTTPAAGGTTTTAAGGTKTGDAGVGLAVAGVTLAGAAAFVARKKH